LNISPFNDLIVQGKPINALLSLLMFVMASCQMS